MMCQFHYHEKSIIEFRYLMFSQSVPARSVSANPLSRLHKIRFLPSNRTLFLILHETIFPIYTNCFLRANHVGILVLILPQINYTIQTGNACWLRANAKVQHQKQCTLRIACPQVRPANFLQMCDCFDYGLRKMWFSQYNLQI
jgi:hypothetical protein